MADTTPALTADLDRLAGDLRAAYGHRRAHGGRLEQIEGMVANLRNVISQLPDEEAREADYEARLLAAHDTGMLPKDAQGEYIGLGHDARERLRDALASRKAAGE